MKAHKAIDLAIEQLQRLKNSQGIDLESKHYELLDLMSCNNNCRHYNKPASCVECTNCTTIYIKTNRRQNYDA